MNDRFSIKSLDKKRKARIRALRSKALNEYVNDIERMIAIATHNEVWECSARILERIENGDTDLNGLSFKRAWIEALEGEEPELYVDAHNSCGDELLGLRVKLSVVSELDSFTPEDVEIDICYDDDGPTLTVD